MKIFVMLGAGLMFLGVGLGAFGAHALSDYFEANPDLAEIFDTAVRYHMIHAVSLLGVAWVGSEWPGSLVTAAGWLIFAGILIFSGSLYLLVMTNTRWLGAITPIGGVAFLAGWVCLLVGVWQG
ncbi:MAG TPA: DUF423 domain-containing protein [Anaerolineae bacterium]|nr:DUF423 domain-containing protein [Anaerolineae bacterium]